jgi:hypothetical protein
MKNKGGVGSIYKVKGSNRWHGKFYHHGKVVRFSCGTESEPEARRVLKANITQAGAGKLPTAATRRTTLDGLRKLVLADYRNNEYDTTARQQDAFDHLAGFFGADCPADEITSARIEEYKIWRREQPDGRTLKRKHIISIRASRRESGAPRRPSTGNWRPYVTLSFSRLARRRRWSRTSRISRCPRSETGGQAFSSERNLRPCATVCRSTCALP